MKWIAVLSNLLHYFYNGIQCDKTCNFVHGEPCEVKHEICQFQAWSFKGGGVWGIQHRILTGLYHIPYYSPYWALSEKAQNFDTVAMVTTYSLWLAEILNDRNY